MGTKGLRVRAIEPDELGAWAEAGGVHEPGLAAAIRELWDSGSGRPEWTFLLEDDGQPLGRVAVAADPIAPEIPTLEHRLVAFRLPWATPGVADLGRRLLDTALAVAPGVRGGTVDARVNAELHDAPDERVRVLEAAGFTPFQDKAGVLWTDDGAPLPPPGRLLVEPLDATNEPMLRGAMARAGEGTLDRVDRHYRAVAGPDGWADAMFGYLTADDRGSWLLAREPDGRVAGYVLLGAFDEAGTGTIVHIGVVPEARGRGYAVELLAAANRAARARGFARILSDVDTANRPMLAAMTKAGHRTGVRPWHVWHLRRLVEADR